MIAIRTQDVLIPTGKPHPRQWKPRAILNTHNITGQTLGDLGVYCLMREHMVKVQEAMPNPPVTLSPPLCLYHYLTSILWRVLFVCNLLK